MISLNFFFDSQISAADFVFLLESKKIRVCVCCNSGTGVMTLLLELGGGWWFKVRVFGRFKK
jgi:hypothetical protein